MFSTPFYLERNPDLGHENPLEHFVRVGAQEGRSPHPMFDISHYWRQRPDVQATGINPLLHYLDAGWKEDVDPHPLFDTSYYLQQMDELGATGLNPLMHFVQWGIHEGLRPHPTSCAEETLCRTS